MTTFWALITVIGVSSSNSIHGLATVNGTFKTDRQCRAALTRLINTRGLTDQERREIIVSTSCAPGLVDGWKRGPQ